MNQLRTLTVAVAAAGLLAAMPAAAIVKIATYSGIVSNGYDQTGVFVAPDTDLTGYTWVAKFTYDKTLGAVQATDGVTYDLSAGGTGLGSPGGSPVIAATITINGVTKSVQTGYRGVIRTATSPEVRHDASYNFDDGITYQDNSVVFIGNPPGAPASLDQNFGPVATTLRQGSVDWLTYDYSRGTEIEYAYARVSSDAVYSVSSAVPEPANWALMIAGFGMVGGALRRRGAALAAA